MSMSKDYATKDYAAVRAAKEIIDNVRWTGTKEDAARYPSDAMDSVEALEDALLYLTHVERHRRDGERLFVALLSVLDTADVTEEGASLFLWFPTDNVAVNHMADVRKKLRRGKTFRKDVCMRCENGDEDEYWEKVGEFIFY